MNSQLAIKISTALVADERLILDTVSDGPHIEDLIADIVDTVLNHFNFRGHERYPGSVLLVCRFCSKPIKEWHGDEECLAHPSSK